MEKATAGTRRPRVRQPGSPSSCERPRSGHRRQGLAQLIDEHLKWHLQHSRPADDDERRMQWGGGACDTIRLAQATPRAVSLHGIAELTAHGKSHARGVRHIAIENDERRSIDSFALLKKCLELRAGGQPLVSRQSPGQTVSRFRPFARRRASTLRPPFVAIRSRNPCVLARRRRFG